MSDVSTNIRMVGQDDATEAIGKVTDSVKKSADSIKNASKENDGWIAGTAKTIAACVAAAVAFDAGTIAATKWSMELEKLRASAQAALGPEGLGKAQDLAEMGGGGQTENYVALAKSLNDVGVRSQFVSENFRVLTTSAQNIGLDAKDGIDALNKAVVSGDDKALKSLGVFVDLKTGIDDYAKAHFITADSVDKNTQAQIRADAIQKVLAGTTEITRSVVARQGDAIDKVSNGIKDMNLWISNLVAEPIVEVAEWIGHAKDEIYKMALSIKEIGVNPFGPMWDSIKRIIEIIGQLVKAAAGELTGVFTAVKQAAHGDFKQAADTMTATLKKVRDISTSYGADIKDEWTDFLKPELTGYVDRVRDTMAKIPDKKSVTLELRGAVFATETLNLLNTQLDQYSKAVAANAAAAEKAHAKAVAAAAAALALAKSRNEFAMSAEANLLHAKADAAKAADTSDQYERERDAVKFDTLRKLTAADLEAQRLHVDSATKNKALRAIEQEESTKLLAIGQLEIEQAQKKKQKQIELNSASELGLKHAQSAAVQAEIDNAKSKSTFSLGSNTGELAAKKALIDLESIELERVHAVAAAKIDAAKYGISSTKAELAIDLDAANKRMAIKTNLARLEKEAQREQISGELAVADAVRGAIDKIGISKRAGAALDAVIEGAKAYASYPDVAGIISHGAAALAFAAIAGGLTGGAPTPPSGGAGPSTGPGSASQGLGGSQNQQPTINNYFLGFGTIQQMGRHIQQATAASNNTGFAGMKAA